MGFSPILQDSGIEFVSQSYAQHITYYTSSNPTLVAAGKHTGSFSGTELHLTYVDSSLTISHPIHGNFTASDVYYTESGTNSGGIAVGSASIFTSSIYDDEGAGNYTGSTWNPEGIATSSMKFENLANGDFMMYQSSSTGATTNKTFFYAKSDGKMSFGEDNPSDDFKINATVKVTDLNIPGLGYGVSESFSRQQTTIDALGTAKANIAGPTFTGTVTAPIIDGTTSTYTNITGSMKGNVNGSSTSCTGNAATATLAADATALATPRTIGGVSFDGTAAIVPTTINVVVDAGDAQHYVMFADSAGNQQPKVDTGLIYNPSTNGLNINGVIITFNAGTDTVTFTNAGTGTTFNLALR